MKFPKNKYFQLIKLQNKGGTESKKQFDTAINVKPTIRYEDGSFGFADGSRSVIDPNEIGVEIYNKSGCDVTFKSLKHNDPFPTVLCKKDDWCEIRHQYYVAHTEDGRPAVLVKNYGDMKRKGNKHSSRPEKPVIMK